MRHRNVKGAAEKLEQHPKVVKHPQDLKGGWKKFFNTDHPIMIEIGMGKGQFITEHAKLTPEINYIGFEKFTSIMAKALEKIDLEEDLFNLVVVREDAENILDLFEENELEGIYLNFSDPWPKERHIKRRLTSKNFLERYIHVLKEGSSIIFKSDNRGLFKFSLEQVKEVGLEIQSVTEDLYNSPYIEANVMTEYEQKFVAQGMKIHRIHAVVNADSKAKLKGVLHEV